MKITLTVDSSELQTIIESLGRQAQRATLLSQADSARQISELQRRLKNQAHDQVTPSV